MEEAPKETPIAHPIIALAAGIDSTLARLLEDQEIQGEAALSCARNACQSAQQLSHVLSTRMTILAQTLESKELLEPAFECYRLAHLLHPDLYSKVYTRRLLRRAIDTIEDLPFNFMRTIGHFLKENRLESEDLLLASDFFSKLKIKGGREQYRYQALCARLFASSTSIEREATRAEIEVLEHHLLTEAKSHEGKPNVFFFSQPWGGTTAISHILFEILCGEFGYSTIPYSSEVQSEWYPLLRCIPYPMYLAGHLAYDSFKEYFGNPRNKFLCLYRDPRDSLLSQAKNYIADWEASNASAEIPQDKEVLLNLIRGELADTIANAQKWRSLPNSICLTFSFDEMKRDIPAMLVRIFNFIGLNISDEVITTLAEKWSFKAVSGHTEDQDEHGIRTRMGWFRKGVSGDWKNYYDEELKNEFEKVCPGVVEEWGFSWDTH